ncbi:MAG: hypothetical protein IAF08_08155 [Rhizobacter sp.]|nr:hypothetical protein [Chlorobiales bacterium]
MKTSFLYLACCLMLGLGSIASPCFAQPAAPSDNKVAVMRSVDSLRVNRLMKLSQLWGNIKYFHPYLAYREINWDSAFAAAVPKVEAASTPAEYAAAVQSMLTVLGDPATSVKPLSLSTQPKQLNTLGTTNGEASPTFKYTADSLLVVTVSNYTDLEDVGASLQKFQTIGGLALTAKGVLFDFRSGAQVASEEDYLSYVFQGFSKYLTASPVRTLAERRRMHEGFTPHNGVTSGSYASAFVTRQSRLLPALSGATTKPVVFLVNGNAAVPGDALALQSENKAIVISEGDMTDAGAVSTTLLKMGEGVTAEYRLGEFVYPDGTTGFQPDLILALSAAGEQNAAYQKALSLLRNFKPLPSKRSALMHTATSKPDSAYAATPYPDRGYRLLAAAHIWTVINYFFPYKDLIGEDWNEVLRTFIPKVLEAKDATAYHLGVAEMVSHIYDTHGFIRSKILTAYYGQSKPPFSTRIVENMPMVDNIFDSAAAAGIHIGDLLLKVDNETAQARLKRLETYIAASTSPRRTYSANFRLLTGNDSSFSTFTLQSASGTVKDFRLQRLKRYSSNFTPPPSDTLKLLAGGNIGYVNLELLPVSQVDVMFEKFKDTKAIVFDMRGYPQGTAWPIAPRLTPRERVAAAQFYRKNVTDPDRDDVSETPDKTIFYFTQYLPKTDKPRYTGKTVMLIDERTQSQAEHTGLFFEAANGTKFIGSPTSGANGDVTNFNVPGGITISFSGQGVRHSDGRQLQRVGLQPDVFVRPTLAGLRAGKDEVLDAAIAYLSASPNAKKLLRRPVSAKPASASR